MYMSSSGFYTLTFRFSTDLKFMLLLWISTKPAIAYILCCTLAFYVLLGFPVFSCQFGSERWQDILFCNFWRSVGWCELQMCMAF